MRPSVGGVIRDRHFSSVDLPAPLAPTSATTLPRGTASDTSHSTWLSP